MRRFITTEAKRRVLDKAWREYDKLQNPASDERRRRAAVLRRWIEDAVALADRGDDLPAFPKHGEDYDP